MDDIKLKLTERKGDYFDYDILVKEEKIGILQTVDNTDSIFGRKIHIHDQFQRKGYATKVIDLLLKESGKDVVICISRHSKSAVAFWQNYLGKRRNEHIRGDIYRLKNEKEGKNVRKN